MPAKKILILVGDFVPVTINKITSIAGVGQPLPYLADQLEKNTGFVYPYDEKNLRDRRESPSMDHLLGTDKLGQDIFSRLLYGARVAVIVSMAAVIISETIGATLGILSGYYGGAVDKFAYRIVDVFQSLPGLVVLITILGLFGSGLWEMVIAIGIVGGPPASRIIRGQTISIMTSPYIEAGRTIGASDLTHTVIKSGLSAGDVIVTGPYKVLESLAHAQKIKPDHDATTKPATTTTTAKSQ